MPTTFFGWVGFLLEQYGPLFLRGAGMTMLIAISGTILGFLIGLLVGIARTIKLEPRAPKDLRRCRMSMTFSMLMPPPSTRSRGWPRGCRTANRRSRSYPARPSSFR